MTEASRWHRRVTDPDPGAAAAVWADPQAPAAILADPPQRVLDFLAACRGPLLGEVLDNGAVPGRVKTRLAGMVTGTGRAYIAQHVFYDQDSVRLWVEVAPALTPRELERAVRVLGRNWRPRTETGRAAAQARVATILKAFAASSDPHCRALAAQAFPLTSGRRHQFARGELSAVRLAADPDIGVRAALARNRSIGQLDDEAGLAVRRALLDDPAPRVRAAARRAGIHLTGAGVAAFLAAEDGHPADLKALEPVAGDPLDDPSPQVRAAAVRGIAGFDARRWARVIADPSPRVRASAATHAYCAPRFAWAGLASDSDARVRKAVARSRWVPDDVLRRMLADPDRRVAAVARTRLPPPVPVRARIWRPEPAGDDLGAAMLAAHPRGEHWRTLEVSAITLTFDQQYRMARHVAADPASRDAARSRVIAGLGESGIGHRLTSRWVRWSSTFGLPCDCSPFAPVSRRLLRPYQGGAPADPLAAGALGLLDAALAILGAQDTEDGRGDYDLLTTPWQRACLPGRHTAADAYGPGTRAALACLHRARQAPAEVLDTLLLAQARTDTAAWAAARAETIDASAASGYPYLAVSLYWESVAAAEAAAGRSPVDPLLAEALWGPAATCVFAGRLAPPATETLLSSWLAAGLIAPSPIPVG